ncbi:hypothetical protein [uncultured Jatrophihabitans sp.]|uniref:hypothetical protein n=1 Tax=uncultured Jatrophihabitans sp. TaxID=1610747 RepID=UPI0035CA0096
MTNLVLRELPESLRRELGRVDLTRRGGRSPDVEVVLDAGGPLMRALFRAEAELLVADALAMESGTYVARDPDERRHDALLLVLQRLAYVEAAA